MQRRKMLVALVRNHSHARFDEVAKSGLTDDPVVRAAARVAVGHERDAAARRDGDEELHRHEPVAGVAEERFDVRTVRR
jgi:hypothetical protein